MQEDNTATANAERILLFWSAKQLTDRKKGIKK